MSLANALKEQAIISKQIDMKRDLRDWISLLVAGVAFLSVLGAGAAANANLERAHKVRLLGFSTSPGGVAFQIPTGGCLDKNDFAVRVIREGTGPVLLQLVTERIDSCRVAVPYGKVIRFTYDEIGVHVGESFVITNTSGIVNRAGYAEIFEPAIEPSTE
jgi:hypothetical protein